MPPKGGSSRAAVANFVQWARLNHDLLHQRASQSPPAKGSAAAKLLGCLRQKSSVEEKRYYHVLDRLIRERTRTFCSEELLLLDEVWRSVSTAAPSKLKDADAALPVVPAAGVSTQGVKRSNVGDDGAVHPSRCVSRRLDAGSEASAGVEGQARNRVDGACNASVLADTYFEIQTDAWCGMHALNNLAGGPYVTRDDCLGAARQVVSRSAQTDPDDLEVLDNHLHKDTGFLSIDVHGAGREVEDRCLRSLFRDITRASNCGCVRVWCGYYVFSVFRF